MSIRLNQTLSYNLKTAKCVPNMPKLKVDQPKNHKIASKRAKPATKQPQTLAEARLEWNAKLKASGFKDLERFNRETGQPLDILHGQSMRSIAKLYNPQRETYFRRIQNFATHNPRWTRDYTKILIMRMHAEGVSYRDMIKELAIKGIHISTYKVYYWVHKLEQASTKWNKTHPEGLDFEPDITSLRLK